MTLNGVMAIILHALFRGIR